MDNVEIAILSRVNELANRYGLKPYDFLASLKYDLDTQRSTLGFVCDFVGGKASEQGSSIGLRFTQMLVGLGITNGPRELIAEDKTIIDTLDQALQAAPKLPHNKLEVKGRHL
jgi:hypothetical protein